MFFTTYIALLALPVLAVATPMPGGSPTTKAGVTTTVTVTATATSAVGTSQCNTGDIQCCNSVQSVSSPAAADLLGLLGVVVQDLNVLVGLTCSPLSVVGLGNGGCSAAPVCCENNNFNGLISIGCVPININL